MPPVLRGEFDHGGTTPIQRIAIAEKYRPIIEKKARENKVKSAEMTNNKLNNTVSQISDKPIIDKVDTKKELSKIANVSYDTYYKGKRILESHNEGEFPRGVVSQYSPVVSF